MFPHAQPAEVVTDVARVTACPVRVHGNWTKPGIDPPFLYVHLTATNKMKCRCPALSACLMRVDAAASSAWGHRCAEGPSCVCDPSPRPDEGRAGSAYRHVPREGSAPPLTPTSLPLAAPPPPPL
ncbi:unnamed protein product [Pleuronectes platessa]|uniref:Uncharacterized protein n=1 Tax=Pleuronectes platessa TaxID=8262 RepID=A0A9N7U325_PLEPL|nr:unnamed protein product [Pleuronectes platessa]